MALLALPLLGCASKEVPRNTLLLPYDFTIKSFEDARKGADALMPVDNTILHEFKQAGSLEHEAEENFVEFPSGVFVQQLTQTLSADLFSNVPADLHIKLLEYRVEHGDHDKRRVFMRAHLRSSTKGRLLASAEVGCYSQPERLFMPRQAINELWLDFSEKRELTRDQRRIYQLIASCTQRMASDYATAILNREGAQ